jgi:hypothetical protein
MNRHVSPEKTMPQISPVPEPENKVARAIATTVRQLLALKVSPIVGLADAIDFRERRELIEQYATIVNAPLYAMMSELAEHTSHVARKDFEAFIPDMLHDHAVLGSVDAAIDDWQATHDEVA